MCCHSAKCSVVLVVLILSSGVANRVFAQLDVQAEQSGAVESEQTPYVSTDPVELRKQSNARYVGVAVQATVTQRFEMYDPHSNDALRELKSMGFTQVILDWSTLHAAATELGLNVVLANWWVDKTSQEEIDKGIFVARAVDRDRLIGFSVMDEPGRNSPDTPFGYYIDLYEQLKPTFRTEFPGTRLEISHWGPMASWDDRYYEYFSFLYEAADVMRIMPYPDLHEAPLDDVFFMIQRSRRLMQIAQTELPLVVILQAWTLPPESKLPEIGELRVMAYQAMLSGAETLSFFEYNLEVWKKTPAFHGEFKQLMSELTEFSLRFRDHAVESKMSEHGVLTSILTSLTGQQHRVEVNTRRTKQEGLGRLEVRTTQLLSQSCVTHPVQVTVDDCCLYNHIWQADCCQPDCIQVPVRTLRREVRMQRRYHRRCR